MTNPADLVRPMFQDVIEMLELASTAFRRQDTTGLEVAAALGQAVHKHEKELTERLLSVQAEPGGLRFVPSHLERIGDAIEGLIRCQRTMHAESTAFTEGGTREVGQLFERSQELLECARDLILTGNRVLARHVEIESLRFHDLATDFARAHEARLVEGVCSPRASSAYLAMLDYLREVTRHARRAAARVAPHEPAREPGPGPAR
jgi:Na+/phosphate symporter